MTDREMDAVIELMQAKVAGAIFNGIKAFEAEPRRILAVLLAARERITELEAINAAKDRTILYQSDSLCRLAERRND